MRGNQLQFSQFQKLRLQKALDQLESLSSASSVLWSVLTSKYVCVRSLLSRYKPKAGDIVIGRVIEVCQNRWRLDINCGQNAYMMLSAMNMPDGLHLSSGQLLTVAPYLVKRQNQHFHHLEHYGIDLILGCNGFIWVGEHVEARDDMIEDQINQSDPQVLIPNKNYVSLEEQEKNYTILHWRQVNTYAGLLMLLEYCPL